VRLATLLHDIDKPVVSREGGERGVTFYNHEVSGARTAKRIAERLKLSKKDQDRVFTLVRWHMFVYESKMTDASIRRFIRRVGKENIHDMLALRVGDRVGGGSKATSWRLTELQKRIGEQFYEPLSLKDLNINGAEIMEILNITPSRKIGEILNTLFEEILDDSSKNTKEYLEKRVKELA
jgi:tRNA nucleotidyltransferase/poly(A) polymerase